MFLVIFSIIGVIIVIFKVAASKKKSDEEVEAFKRREASKTVMIKRQANEQFAMMKNKLDTLSKEKYELKKAVTTLAAFPGRKENFCTCEPGGTCTCEGYKNRIPDQRVRQENFTSLDLPIRPAQIMVAGAVGKAKKLKAEMALRGSAPGLPGVSGGMYGKESILSLEDVKEAFAPNRGRF
jgi:hypothetical protein